MDKTYFERNAEFFFFSTRSETLEPDQIVFKYKYFPYFLRDVGAVVLVFYINIPLITFYIVFWKKKYELRRTM